MTTPVLSVPVFRAFDAAGLPLASGLLYCYAAGTSTPKDTYSDDLGHNINANPVLLDTTGSAVVRLGSGAYKFVLRDAADTTTLWSIDQVYGGTQLLTTDNTWTGTNTASAVEPRWLFNETDAGANGKLWDIDVQGGVLTVRTRTDVDGAGKAILTVARSGTAITTMDYGNTTDNPAHKFHGPITGLGIPVTVVRTSNNASSSTTLANDTQLVRAIDSSIYTQYLYELFAHITGGAGGISYNMNFSGTATASGVSNICGTAVYNGTGTVLTMKGIEVFQTVSSYSTATVAATNPQDCIHLRGKLKVLSDGTLGFSFGLNSASGSVTVGQGSWLSVMPIG